MNKELTPLERFREIIKHYTILFNRAINHPIDTIVEWVGVEEIEKSLKALEIILKNYDFKVAKNNNAYWLQYWVKDDCMGQMPISKEEYDLLKEVLL